MTGDSTRCETLNRLAARARVRQRVRWSLGVMLVVVSFVAMAQAGKWLSIAADGLHDPRSPAVGMLQEPREALSTLPPDTAGNNVQWVQAIDEKYIQPRSNIYPETRVNLRTTDVLLKRTSDRGMVRFPHRQHTALLDCSNCHDELFAKTAGATPIGMLAILMGEKCGLCHGAVSFPLTECDRCHSVKRGSPEHLEFGDSLVIDRAVR